MGNRGSGDEAPRPPETEEEATKPPEDSPGRLRDVYVSRAEAGRSIAVNLAAMSVAVLTFTLFFLFPQNQAGKINPLLFQLTLDVLVLALFALLASRVYYSRSTIGFQRQTPVAHSHLAMGYLFLVSGIALFALAPALILFTAGLWAEGIVATVLWFLLQVLTVASRKEFALS